MRGGQHGPGAGVAHRSSRSRSFRSASSASCSGSVRARSSSRPGAAPSGSESAAASPSPRPTAPDTCSGGYRERCDPSAQRLGRHARRVRTRVGTGGYGYVARRVPTDPEMQLPAAGVARLGGVCSPGAKTSAAALRATSPPRWRGGRDASGRWARDARRGADRHGRRRRPFATPTTSPPDTSSWSAPPPRCSSGLDVADQSRSHDRHPATAVGSPTGDHFR